MSKLTRRNFLGAAAVMAGGLTGLQKVVGAELHGADRSKSDPGPSNPALDGQNPDSIWPPSTDSKSLVQNFKYPFSFANKRTYEGGWSREVTVRELPVSKTLAGVNMRLTPGGFRELHLAHGRRMGHHALRKRADYGHRSGRQKFRRRRGQK